MQTKPDLKFKGGGSFISKQPKFSLDGQAIFVVWNNVLLSYSTKTGKRLREYRGLWDSIVGFHVTHVDGCEFVIACSKNGEVISWKAELGFRMFKIDIPIKDCVVETFNLLHNNKFLFSYSQGPSENAKVSFAVFSIASRKLTKVNLKLDKGPYKVAVSLCENPYFAIIQNRQFFFIRLSNLTKVYRQHLEKKKVFTCVACHPEEECVITGDSLGRILLWYNLDSASVQPGVYHWHTLPVNCLAFSSSGGNFFSGGNENVLVKWHFDDTHRKNFLPRLPSSIQHICISYDNVYAAVATGDNAIHVLDAQFNTVSVIQHLVLGSDFPAGIVYDGRSKCMILNGLTGHVQFYVPHDMLLLFNLDVVGQNKLTQERGTHIENTVVTNIGIDDNGIWLATVEERLDATFTFELRLKFWFFNVTKQQFESNTYIEFPHEKSIIHLLFQPKTSDPRCVTIANDDTFKIWHCTNADTIYHKSKAWSCAYTGKYRDLPCKTLAFSCDGSLLGIGFGPIITTWEPDTCKLKCSLLHPSHRNDLKAMHFGIASQCHLIVAATTHELSVWNLLTLSMLWTVSLKITHLVASSIVSCMAAFTASDKVYVFSPDSSSPLFVYDFVPEMGQVVTAAFLPGTSSIDSKVNWFKAAQLFFINSKGELFCFDTDEDNIDSFDLLSEDLNSGLFKSMAPKKKSTPNSKLKPVRHLTKLSSNNNEIRELLNAPIHTMKPQRITCETILRSIILEHIPVK